jgi:hypothetical protein
VYFGSRASPGGDQLRWRTVGIDQAAAEPSLPFFIEWAAGTDLPGKGTIRHRGGTAKISRLVIGADPGRLAGWLGDHQLPIEVRPATPPLSAIYISSGAGEIVIGPAES